MGIVRRNKTGQVTAPKWPASEADLAPPLTKHLTEQGWDVYPEVSTPWGRLDLVARAGNVLWGIELKRSFGLAVLDQAIAQRFCCHFVSVAVPEGEGYRNKASYNGHAASHVLRAFGIGVFVVGQGSVRVSHEPRMQRNKLMDRYVQRTRDSLCEEMKQLGAAGTNDGQYYTPFKVTCANLRDYLGKNGGSAPLKDAIEKIDHHYSKTATARSSLVELLKRSVIKGMALEYQGRTAIVRLTE